MLPAEKKVVNVSYGCGHLFTEGGADLALPHGVMGLRSHAWSPNDKVKWE